MVPGIQQILADLNAEIDQLEKSVQPTFEGLVEPLERISDRLGRAWGTVSHLKAVCDNKELREAVAAVEPEKVKIGLRISQSRPLYEAFKQLKEQQWDNLSGAQRRVVDNELRDFVLGGACQSQTPTKDAF